MSRKAVVLLSGGLDSSTVLYMARADGYRTFCLIFDYGQRHRKEIKSAQVIARKARSAYKVVKFNLPWKGSSLLDRKMAVPRASVGAGGKQKIPSTYVPARNTIFISFGLSCAEAIGATTVFIGANSLDYSGYPDCRPGYYRAFGRLASLATKRGVEGEEISIATPLLRKTKLEILRQALSLGVPLEMTWSCYKGNRRPCGVCDSCLLREKAFSRLKIRDPLFAGKISEA
ncbi:MAG: 7-cyano-7-deazaguanine synthase QueC [Candidatus Omnitrophota bacterium]